MTRNRKLLLALFAIFVVAGFTLLLVFYKKPRRTVPEAAEIQSMVAALYNSPQKFPDIPEFTVPAEHIPRILDAMKPAKKDDQPMKWQVLGHLKMACNDNDVVEVHLYWTRHPLFGAFSVRGGSYYLGGSDKGIEDAIRAAYADSQK